MKVNKTKTVNQNNTPILLITAIISLLLDQCTKYAAKMLLTVGERVVIIPNFFSLTLSFNDGVAFGMAPKFGGLLALLGIIIFYTIYKFKMSNKPIKMFSVGVGLIAGGAIGNLADRFLTPQKAVIDFIDFSIKSNGQNVSWPTFNIADLAIIAGALIIFFANRPHRTAK